MFRLVVRESMILVAAGVAAGIAAAFGATRLLATFLFGVTPNEPAVFVAAPVLLGAVALLASLLPSRHARQSDDRPSLGVDGQTFRLPMIRSGR